MMWRTIRTNMQNEIVHNFSLGAQRPVSSTWSRRKSVNKSMSLISRTDHLMQLPVIMSKNTLRVLKSVIGFYWPLEQKKSGARLIWRRVGLIHNGNRVIVTPETGPWTTCMSSCPNKRRNLALPLKVSNMQVVVLSQILLQHSWIMMELWGELFVKGREVKSYVLLLHGHRCPYKFPFLYIPSSISRSKALVGQQDS